MANFYKIKYSGKQLEELLDQIYDIPYSSGDGIILAETQIQANVTTILYSDGLYYWYINGDKTNIVNPDGEGATAPTATIGENGFWYLNGQQTNLLVPSGKSISLDPNYAKFTNYLTTEKVNEQLEPILTDIANLKVTKQDSLIAGNCITIQNNTISTTVDIPTQISDLPNDANYVNLNEVKNYVDPIDETLRSDIASHGTRLSTLESAIQNKVDKVDGKGLSTNDFTTEYKTQLDDLSTTYATKQDLTDIINGAPEEYDTLKEIAEWIKSDESGSAAMTSDIATLKSYFTNGSANKALADQSGNNIETTYTKISDFNALSAEVETKQDNLISGTNIKTVNGNSLIGSGNIDVSDNVTINLGELSSNGGTLGAEILSQINSNLETKHIIFTGVIDSVISCSTGAYISYIGLLVISFASHSDGTPLLTTLTINMNGGEYSINFMDALAATNNIKTINGNSLIGSGNIEISGSNFQIIDVTSSSKNNSISSLYNEITQVVDAEPPTFSNQSEIYNNIATAVNNGLVPILKFTDGYGYYKEYLSSSGEYVFTLNHFILNSEKITDNIIITLKVGNTTNSGSNINLFKIPYTIVIQDAFSDSGSINNLDEMLSVLSGVATTSFGKIGGLFLYNVAEMQLYNIYSLNPQATGSDAILEAYTILNNKIVYIKFTAGQGRYDYTKTTYALGGGGGDSNIVVIDLGTLEELTGTLSPDILSKINSAISENKNIIIKIDAGFIFPNVMYDAGFALYATGFIYDNPDLIAASILIDLSNGQYNSSEFRIQEKLVSGTNIKTVNGQSILGSGNIEISGGGATKMVNLGTLSETGGTLDAGKLQELMTLFQNGDLIQATFVLNNSQFITASAYSIGSSMGIVAHAVVAELDAVAVADLSINTANGNYTITPIAIPTSFKTINDSSLFGRGNINLQEPLVSGSNIKTINGQTILSRGNINLQETLVSGSNIKTINGQSLLGSGDLPITTDITYATDNEVNNLFTHPGQPIPDKTISLENLNAFKQQINNEIGKVLEEGF